MVIKYKHPQIIGKVWKNNQDFHRTNSGQVTTTLKMCPCLGKCWFLVTCGSKLSACLSCCSSMAASNYVLGLLLESALPHTHSPSLFLLGAAILSRLCVSLVRLGITAPCTGFDKKIDLRSERWLSRWERGPADLTEDGSSVPGTHIRWFITAWNLSCRASDALF